jgi:transcriptional regulator with XRE-family HTH domain
MASLSGSRSARVDSCGRTCVETFSGDEIMRFRKRLGFGSREFADALGVSRVTLYRWEADGFTRWPRTPSAFLLQWMLGLEEDELVALATKIRRKPERATAILFASRARP